MPTPNSSVRRPKRAYFSPPPSAERAGVREILPVRAARGGWSLAILPRPAALSSAARLEQNGANTVPDWSGVRPEVIPMRHYSPSLSDLGRRSNPIG